MKRRTQTSLHSGYISVYFPEPKIHKSSISPALSAEPTAHPNLDKNVQ